MTMNISEDLKNAIANLHKWKYQIQDGTVIRGTAVSGVPGFLREYGWRNVPRIDSYDLKKAGFTIVRARAVTGSGRLAKECDVLVLG